MTNSVLLENRYVVIEFLCQNQECFNVRGNDTDSNHEDTYHTSCKPLVDLIYGSSPTNRDEQSKN